MSVLPPNRSVMKPWMFVPTTLLLLVSSTRGLAQYEVLWLTSPETASYTLDNTPFPTGAGRAVRTQYLVRSEMLEQSGLQPGLSVIGVSLAVVDSDAVDPACVVNIHTAMKNEVTMSLTDLVYTGLLATGDVNPLTIQPGMMTIGFTTPWQWSGIGQNAVLEISWERGDDSGLNPRIMLDTALSYTATFTARTEQNVQASAITSGYPSDVQVGNDNSLPSMALLVQTPSGIEALSLHGAIHSSPNPVSDLLNIRSTKDMNGMVILDLEGRTVVEMGSNGRTGSMDVAVLSPGCYSLRVIHSDGLVSISRFIKQ